MSIQTDLRAIEERFVEEVINRGDMRVFDELIAPDWSDEGGGEEGPWDREKLRELITAWRSGMPDLRGRITHLVAEGDLCALRMIVEGTHTQQYFDLAPTGTKVSGALNFFDRIVDGRIVESWTESGGKGFYEQISGRPIPKELTGAATN